LRVRQYKHGVRSLQAAVEMSTLSEHSRFVIADLPSDDHLRLHVSEDFSALLRAD
jgi:hypothetical protein